MADPTVPWGIPLFDDNTPFAPIQAPFNAQSAALNVALNSLDSKGMDADAALRASATGAFGSDGGGSVGDYSLTRSPSGIVYLSFRATRTSGTYATNLILGVLPPGFRPTGNVNFGGCLTYGSGSINQIQALANGIVQLVTPSPAGHTVVDGSITFKAPAV